MWNYKYIFKLIKICARICEGHYASFLNNNLHFDFNAGEHETLFLCIFLVSGISVTSGI
jgi:hypothetical protein